MNSKMLLSKSIDKENNNKFSNSIDPNIKYDPENTKNLTRKYYRESVLHNNNSPQTQSNKETTLLGQQESVYEEKKRKIKEYNDILLQIEAKKLFYTVNIEITNSEINNLKQIKELLIKQKLEEENISNQLEDNAILQIKQNTDNIYTNKLNMVKIIQSSCKSDFIELERVLNSNRVSIILIVINRKLVRKNTQQSMN